jgi:hypothetical protein
LAAAGLRNARSPDSAVQRVIVEIHWIHWTAASASATVDCTEQHAPLLDLERFHSIHLHNVINDRY